MNTADQARGIQLMRESMTFKIIVRGSADRPIAAEYMCPKHGRFTLTVDRDANGDPPGEMPCPVPPVLDDEWFAAVGRRTGMSRAELEESMRSVTCERASPFCVSAPRVTVRRIEAVRGGWQKPERKTWLDTRNLGEGQDLDDFRRDREKIRDEERRASLKELIDE